MRRHEKALWSPSPRMELLMEVSILTRGWSLADRVPEYTYRLRKKGIDLSLFSIGRVWLKGVLRNCYYSSLYEVDAASMRDMVRFMEIPPSRVKCASQALASKVMGVEFGGWDSLFRELEGK